MGLAVPHRIGRHTHPATQPDAPPPPAPETGIDYLRLIAADRETQRSQGINFTAITGAGGDPPTRKPHPHDDCDTR
jgi:putative transposase